MLLRSTARFAVARGVPALIGFLSLAVFTRLLSQEEYGRYALIIAAVGLVNAVGFQWLGLAALRYLNAAPSRERFLGALLASYLKLAGWALVLGIAVVFFRPAGWPPAWVLGSLGILIGQAWFDLNANIATADQDPRRYGLLFFTRATLILLLGGLSSYLGWGTTGLVCAVLVAVVTPGVLASRGVWAGVGPGAGDAKQQAALLRYGWPLAGIFLLDFLVRASDRLLLGALRGAGEAGTYSASYDLSRQAIWALMMLVNLAAFPRSTDAVDRGSHDARQAEFRRHVGLLLALAVPAAAGIAVLAPGLARVALGPGFAEAGSPLLPLFAAAALLGGLKSFYFDLSFQLGGRTDLQLLTVVAAAAASVLLNLLWIPRLGVMGAAYATLASYGIGLALSWGVGRRIVARPVPLAATVRTLLSTLVMTLALWPLRGHHSGGAVAGQVLLGLLIYCLTAWLLDVADSRRWLRLTRPEVSAR